MYVGISSHKIHVYTLFTLSAKAKMRLVKGLIEQQGDVNPKPQTITLKTQ